MTEYLRKNEAEVYQIISQGIQPSNLEDLFPRVALRFAQPRQVQTLLTTVLQENGRLVDPVHNKGHNASCDVELKRSMIFQTIVLECLSMKQYYELLYSNDEAKISPWLGQGVFTPDFLGVLLSCTPYN